MLAAMLTKTGTGSTKVERTSRGVAVDVEDKLHNICDRLTA